MPEPVGRDETRRLVEEEGAIVAEVLPRADYEWAHIRGAVHLPLRDLSSRLADEVLDHARPVIVYCNDYQ
ncbi:MAG: rhodanese-like domain-containing protein [Actinomycetota bacterium]|nr:rhodanese-like domain-containing protein [Actinomycetota bacterium]